MSINSNMQTFYAYDQARTLRRMERRLEHERRLTDQHILEQWREQQYGPRRPSLVSRVWAWVWEKITR